MKGNTGGLRKSLTCRKLHLALLSRVRAERWEWPRLPPRLQSEVSSRRPPPGTGQGRTVPGDGGPGRLAGSGPLPLAEGFLSGRPGSGPPSLRPPSAPRSLRRARPPGPPGRAGAAEPQGGARTPAKWSARPRPRAPVERCAGPSRSLQGWGM